MTNSPTVTTILAEDLIEHLRREIEAAQPQPADPATEDDSNELLDRIVRRSQYTALKAMLSVLAGWVEGARGNCEAVGHGRASAHNGGLICGEQFDIDDIRNMINDTARELGTAQPWTGA